MDRVLMFPDRVQTDDYETELRRTRLAARVLRMNGDELRAYEQLASEIEEDSVLLLRDGVLPVAVDLRR